MTKPNKFITLSPATASALAELATPGWQFSPGWERQPDGSLRVELLEGTHERLLSVQLAGETMDDTLLRVAMTSRKPKH